MRSTVLRHLLQALPGIVIATLLLAGPLGTPPAAADGDVSVYLQATPDVITNPGGTVTIHWIIDPESTTPDYVVYKLLDPPHTTVIETQTYPGATGIDVTRTWTAPSSPMLPDGTYWVRVEYYAVGIGLEAVAEVNFDLETPTPVEPSTWGRILGLFR